MPTVLNKTIRLFLDSIGRRDEYEFYLRKFTNDRTPAFALLCPERSGIEEMASVFAFDLSFLLRLELHPAIVLCAEEAVDLDILLAEGHDLYAVHQLPESPETGTEDVVAFLEQCSRTARIGVIVAPGRDLRDTLAELVPAVSRRIHFIRLSGPLHDNTGESLPYFYLTRSEAIGLEDVDRQLIELAAHVLNRHPTTHISICSPWNLLQELFTVRGAGCVIRKGSTIERVCDIRNLDCNRLMRMLHESFGKEPIPERVLAQLSEAYLETDYRGAVLLERQPPGMYLAKFAVGTQARGEGLANELWREVSRDHPALFWRAREDNPVNQWYERHADGLHREGKWRVFWRGIGADSIQELIRFCLDRPSDFVSGGDTQ